MKYRIVELDYEEPDIVHEVFEAKSDKEAIKHFMEFKAIYNAREYESLGVDGGEFELLKIVQEEKTKCIAT